MYGRDQRMEIGRRLQQLRGARDQRTFAEAVGSVQQTISKYERGEIPRSWFFLARLVDEEGIDLNALLGGNSRGPRGGSEEEPFEGNGHGHQRETGRQGAVEDVRAFAASGGRAAARF